MKDADLVEFAGQLRNRVDFGVLEKWVNAQIEGARSALENDQPEVSTATLRGQIRAYRDLLKLPAQVERLVGQQNNS